jgi:hypothetical protein
MINYNNEQNPIPDDEGYYHFICLRCGKPFSSKCPTALTCSERCRNAKNYRIRKTKFVTVDSFNQACLHNAKVLDTLVEEKCFLPIQQSLELLKWNWNAHVKPAKIDEHEYYFFGDYGIAEISEGHFKLKKKQNEQKN